MPINAIKSVRNLELNCKRRRHKYTAQKRREAKCDTGPRTSNLIRIKKHSNRSNTNIIIGTCNTQSIHNKDLQVSDLLDDYSIDLLMITETWLTDKEMDKQWIKTTPLNRQPYQLHTCDRVNGRGGGVALITKSCFDIKQIQCGSYPSFEYATWEVTIRRKMCILQPYTTHPICLEISPPIGPFWMTSPTL